MAKNENAEAEAQIAADQLAALLDVNLDDVADLPEYLDYVPTGSYRLRIEKKEDKVVEMKDSKSGNKVKAPVIQLVYSIQEVLELAKADEEHPKINSRFNESFFFHNDPQKTLEVIKAKFAAVAQRQGYSNIKELMDNLQGLEIGATVKSKKDKNDDEKFYIQVSNATLI